MKTHRSLLSALLALSSVVAASSVPAAPSQNSSLMHPVEVVNVKGSKFTLGAPMSRVLQVLGEPAQKRFADPSGKLDENVWMYRDMEGHGSDFRTARDGCHTFLVTFVDAGAGRGWRVAEMKLVNGGAERYFAANIRAKATDVMFASR